MADSIDVRGGPPQEDVAYKLLYLVAWAENIDLEGWGKTNRKDRFTFRNSASYL